MAIHRSTFLFTGKPFLSRPKCARTVWWLCVPLLAARPGFHLNPLACSGGGQGYPREMLSACSSVGLPVKTGCWLLLKPPQNLFLGFEQAVAFNKLLHLLSLDMWSPLPHLLDTRAGNRDGCLGSMTAGALRAAPAAGGR